MGEKKTKNTHIERPSIIQLAKLWKHGSNRAIIIAALLILFTITLLYVFMQGTAVKPITVILNGQETILKTKESDLQSFLDEQGIIIREHDRISKQINEPLYSGDVIVIDHVIPVRVTADGETRTLYTNGQTIQAAIQDLNIFVGEEDRIIPAENSKITMYNEIEIVRVQTIIEEQEDLIPFEEVTRTDDSLVKGKERLVQEGQEGVVRTKVKKILENGILISEQVIDEVVEIESTDRIVAVGTKNPVRILSASSPDVQNVIADGVSFSVKQVLNNVTLTAYDAGINSTGKTEEDPQYGITFTGTTVKEGRTVAVDPKVIPLGWWIYIEGIGLRKAEDIGSAIKGNKVDVYMESEAQANRFGRQRGHTVYIVGPNKPALN